MFTTGQGIATGVLAESPVGWFVIPPSATVTDTRAFSTYDTLTGQPQQIFHALTLNAAAQRSQYCGAGSVAFAEARDTTSWVVDLAAGQLSVQWVDDISLGIGGWGACGDHVRKSDQVMVKPVLYVPFRTSGTMSLDLLLQLKTTSTNQGPVPIINAKALGGFSIQVELWKDGNQDGKLNGSDALLTSLGISSGYSDEVSRSATFTVPANITSFIAKIQPTDEASYSYLLPMNNVLHSDDLREWNTASVKILPR